MKHPALRVAAWTWIAAEYRARIADCIIKCAVPTLPFRPARVEVVGSLARGCAHAGSDLDLNLAAHDWNEQVEWRRIWADPRHRAAFMDALLPVTSRLGMNIEGSPDNPDQHTYDLSYDLLTGVFTDPGSRFPDPSSRWWDGEVLRWKVKPLARTCSAVSTESWPEPEVTHWRSVYQDRFQTQICSHQAWGRDPAGVTLEVVGQQATAHRRTGQDHAGRAWRP